MRSPQEGCKSNRAYMLYNSPYLSLKKRAITRTSLCQFSLAHMHSRIYPLKYVTECK